MTYVNRAKCEFNGYAGQFFREQGVECRTVYRSERDDWVLAMIRSGLGFGFMPQFSVTDPAVIARPLIEPDSWRTVNLCTVRGRPHSPAVGALVREAMRVDWLGLPAMAVTQIKNKHRARGISLRRIDHFGQDQARRLIAENRRPALTCSHCCPAIN